MSSYLRRNLDEARAQPADFRDDGGTPAWRAAHPPAPGPWALIRFLFLFPLVATFGGLCFALFWIAAAILIGEPWASGNWGWLAAGAFLCAADLLRKGGGFGRGPLGVMKNDKPIRSGFDAITFFGGRLALYLYGSYAVLFWTATICFGLAYFH